MMPSIFLTADWKNLIMANYIVDPAILKPYLPNKTELDIFNGNIYVSLVGFMFMNTRLLGLKIPFHINFEEVNLRFYVRYNDNGEWKRGTVFIKEIVPKPAISFIANTIYHEKYATKKMDHFFIDKEQVFSIGYQWKHQNKWNKMEVVTEKTALPMQAGSEEEFIAEHYRGYSKYDHTTTYEYHVQHPAWKVYRVKNYLIDCDFTSLYGTAFSALQHSKPNSVFVAEGSAISVLKKRKL
ncbi:MAG: DUF2071 domain-containing protein [Ferruginibacter sp.]